jgi:hypothetical protein
VWNYAWTFASYTHAYIHDGHRRHQSGVKGSWLMGRWTAFGVMIVVRLVDAVSGGLEDACACAG